MPRAAEAAAPLGAAEFERLMAGLGPFERRPRIAVAVSGGADSMALALLAREWARARRGRAVALTVDHGLRPEAAAEARQAGRWLASRGIEHHVLRWREPPPKANLQAAARAARYRLLEEWCRAAGILHLLLAHQREDQAETLLLRLGRGSGVDGLAAMPPLAETGVVRHLRPLLAVPRARLAATLAAAGQNWLEDPSNRDPRHGRVRLRGLLPALAAEGLTSERLGETARRLGRARQALELEAGRLLARAAHLDPAGYAMLDAPLLVAAPAELGLRALARLLQAVGGEAYPPRLERLERLHAALAKGLSAGRTLGGCRLLRRGGHAPGILVCRELAAMTAATPVSPGGELWWDGRFRVAFARRFPRARGAVTLAPLGLGGWDELLRRRPALGDCPVPGPVRPTLPALFDLEGLLALPHLSYGRGGDETGTVYVHRLAFRPPRPLAIGPITVA